MSAPGAFSTTRMQQIEQVGTVADTDRDRARNVVLGSARDVEDARMLFDMLGLGDAA